jgi:peptidoglycan/xylan/chitin deacetylase (PgdA/CDA1 family)
MGPGTFIISLDFELFWGVRDAVTLGAYGANVLGVRHAIPALLETFEQHRIAATWATVGFLFFRSKADLMAHLPEERPVYDVSSLSPYPAIDGIGLDEEADPYHFGRSLLEQIRKVPLQEIGSHTFSHYYALERGQTAETFRHDLRSAVRAGKHLGVDVRSLVFPRNQYNQTYVGICRELGFTSYRGNERSWIYRERRGDEELLWNRGVRLLDSYVNMSGHHTFRLADVARSGPPFNLPASRFLRPWSHRLRMFEEPRLRRIERALTYAARHGEAFHLWWHPHNFGVNLTKNLANLKRILSHFDRLRDEYGMQSASMGEVANRLLRKHPSQVEVYA